MTSNNLLIGQQDELQKMIDLLSKQSNRPDPYDCVPDSSLKEIIYPEYGNIYYLGTIPPYMYKKVNNKWVYVGEASFEGYDDDLMADEYDDDEFYSETLQNRDNLVITNIYYNKDTEENKRAIDEYILTLPDNLIAELNKNFIDKCFSYPVNDFLIYKIIELKGLEEIESRINMDNKEDILRCMSRLPDEIINKLSDCLLEKCFSYPVNDILINRIVELRGVEIFESNTNQQLIDKIRELREEYIFTHRHIKSNQELVDIILEYYGLPIWWKEPAIQDERRKAVKKIQTELIQNYGIGIPFDIKEKICLLSLNKAKKLLKSHLTKYIGIPQCNLSFCDILNNNTYPNTILQIKIKAQVQEDDFLTRLGRIFYW